MEIGSGTSRARSHRNHRMGHVGKVRARHVTARSPSLAPQLSYIISPRLRRSSSRGFNAAAWRIHQSSEMPYPSGSKMFQAPTPEEMALFDEPVVADLASGSN